jgi:hypothetical protein
MTSFHQRILYLFQNCTKKIIPFALSLAACSERRSYAGIARSLDVSYEYIYDYAKSIHDKSEQIMQAFIGKVKKYQTRACKGYVLVDFTRLAKSKDAQTPFTTWDRDGRINGVNNGFSVGFCAWTNGKITIPLSFSFWVNKKNAGESYIAKKDLVKALLIRLTNEIDFEEVIVDGEFATYDMLNFCADQDFDITARIARNRNVVTDDGTKAQLQAHPALRLTKNKKSRTVGAFYCGRFYNFTTVKYRLKGGKKKIVFIISSKNRTSKEHVNTYKFRWNIEKFFRTAKQSLGLEQCQAQKIDQVINHINAVMVAFVALEEVKYLKKKRSPEAVLGILKSKNNVWLIDQYIDLVETFATF